MSVPHVYNFILDHRVGGPHVYVDSMRKAMAGRVQSTIVTTGRGPLTDYSLLNLRHFWAPLYALEMVINTLLLIVWTLTGKFNRHNSVFAVHGGANLAALLVARLVGIPVIWYFHETTPRFRRLVSIGKWLLNGHVYSLAVVAKKCNEAYGLKNTVLLPAAVDPLFWSLEAANQIELDTAERGSVERDTVSWNEAGKASSPLRILAVGNLNPLKGIDILLSALSEKKQPGHLKIVGASLSTHKDYAALLQNQADDIMLENKLAQIDFLGWQDKEQIRSLLEACDVFVLPSRSEACPIALLEAMSMCCAIVSTDVGDVSEYIKNGENGFVVPVGDSKAMSDAIAKLIGDVELRQQFGRRAREVSCRELDINVIAEKTASAYEAIIA